MCISEYFQQCVKHDPTSYILGVLGTPTSAEIGQNAGVLSFSQLFLISVTMKLGLQVYLKYCQVHVNYGHRKPFLTPQMGKSFLKTFSQHDLGT